jgi:DNA-binding transcriptional regulator YbjK
MSTIERMEQELRAARRELAEAELGLKENTEAARTRYARAVHEAELAERMVARMSRQRSWLSESWRLAGV